MMSINQLFSATDIKISASEIGAPSVAADSNALQDGLGMVYFIAGIVCVIMIIIGGIRYVTSQGDSGGVQSAKNTVLYAVIGLVVILLAAAVTQLIFQVL